MITPRLVTTLLAHPAIIHRLKGYMIAIGGGQRSWRVELEASLALAAMTKAPTIADDHREEAINQQFGMGR